MSEKKSSGRKDKSEDTYEYIGYVYVIHDAERNLCKIGMTRFPGERIATVARAAGCNVKDVFISKKTKNARRLELLTHELFNTSRTKGEWFYCNFEEAKKFIEQNVEPVSEDYIKEKKKEQEESSQRTLEFFQYVLHNIPSEPLNKSNSTIDPSAPSPYIKWIDTKQRQPTKYDSPILANMPYYAGVEDFQVLHFNEKINCFAVLDDPLALEITADDIFQWVPIRSTAKTK